ncbi:expressed unknown protein [Seminavis robusta]|uniref:Actin-like ATPase domain-containing protein n=1 Tax=Seminavis robusta TaxID=568900 RepID=A0A9N8F1N1_9STRA|nr:expressed unknown protein [Seminavis robusta]|eukprot:Sro2827_g338030.1 n/a (367) ;mRNA; f:2652-3914
MVSSTPDPKSTTTTAVPSTPRVATRRVTRFSPRPFSSPLAAARNVGRPPIVLEWGSTMIRVGYAEQFQPQHIIPLPRDPFQKLEAYQKEKKTDTWMVEEESRWYDVVSPIIRQVFDRLMVDPTTRRVLVVSKPYPLKTWEMAVMESLWNLGVPAVVFLNSLEVIPVAQGWKRGLVVTFGQDESHFLAYVDGHPLPFTYQVVPTGYKHGVEDDSKITCEWDDKMEKAWLDTNNPNSLVVALLKCLEACPLDSRKDVIANMLVCGDSSAVVPDLPRRLAVKLKAVLGEEEATSDPASTTEQDDFPLTMVLPAIKLLKPLAGHVGLLSCAPYRSDLISWVGGSIHATLWHRQEDQSPVQWVLSPTGAAE